ncbi:DUF11 domain-containing protein [Spirillospora sp. NPDC052269]
MIQKGTGRIGARGLAVLTAVPLLGVVPVLVYQVAAQADGPVSAGARKHHRGHKARNAGPRARPHKGGKTGKFGVSVGPGKAATAAKLVLQTSGPTAQLVPGHTYSWPFTVTNNGKSKAAPATLKAPLPASLEYVSGPEACSFAVNTGGASAIGGASGGAVCAIGALKPGQTVKGALNAKVSTKARPRERVASTATVWWGSSSVSKQFPATTVVETADVSVVRRGPEATRPGQAIPYVTTVTNAGPAAAQNVVVSGTLPQGAVLNGSSCSAAATGGAGAVSGNGAPNGYVCNLGTLEVGAKKEIRTSVTLRGAKRGQVLEAPVHVSTSTTELNLVNNNTTFKTRVLRAPVITAHRPVHEHSPTSGRPRQMFPTLGRPGHALPATEHQAHVAAAPGGHGHQLPTSEQHGRNQSVPGRPAGAPKQLPGPAGQIPRLRHAVIRHGHLGIPHGLHFLPRTGDESALIVDGAIGLLGGGLILMFVGRRRRVIRSSE